MLGAMAGCRSRRWVLSLIAVAAALAIVGCGGSDGSGSSEGAAQTAPDQAKKTLKIGVLYYDTGNSNWSKAYTQALEGAINNLGVQNQIKLTNVQSVPYTPEATNIVERLFADGNDVVLEAQTLGKLYYEGCAKFPDRECLSYYPVERKAESENVSGYYPRLWQGSYVEGVAAGLLTKTNILGWVGAYELPNNVSLVNAYALGCQSVNPACQVRPVYINSFFDPPKATQAAQTLINAGADVLNHYQDDPSVIKVAQREGKWAFGLYLPTADAGPDAYVTGLLMPPGLTKYWEKVLPQLLDGTFTRNPLELDGLESVNFLDKWGPKVPADVKAQAESVEKKIKGGEDVFVGPITDNKGTVRVAAGDTISDDMFYDGMDWYVKGVISKK